MLKAVFLINSSIREVLAFKCCSLPDMNLEILVTNVGGETIRVQNRFALLNDEEKLTVTAVYPPGGRTVEPGETAALYCSMDPDVWQRFRTAVLFDSAGNEHPFTIAFSP